MLNQYPSCYGREIQVTDYNEKHNKFKADQKHYKRNSPEYEMKNVDDKGFQST